MITLALELKKRGHAITFLNIPDLEPRVRQQGLGFCAIGQDDHPIGSLQEFTVKMGQLKGIAALKFGMATAIRETRSILNDAPDAIRKSGISALLIDQGEPAGSSVAEHTGIPFATVCHAVPANRDPDVPPSNTPWSYGTSWWVRLRNWMAYEGFDLAVRSWRNVINESRRKWGLRPLASFEDSYSPLVQVGQFTPEFDFPHKKLPAHFHYIGQFEREATEAVGFPFERLNGKPLVYAVLGTIQTGLNEVYRRIAEACSGMAVQLVISMGSRDREVPEDLRALPGSPIVVNFAPQEALQERSVLTICHGGINTVMGSLRYGAPCIAIPIAVDQPGTGARLQRCGAGETIALQGLTAERLREVVDRVLKEPQYRERAQTIGRSILAAGGTARAADFIVEAVLPAIREG